MTIETVRVSSRWLELREPADAAARSAHLVEEVRRSLPSLTGRVGGSGGGLEIHDLGCGTGSMARWLGPRLDGPQHWVLHDRDADLLLHAAANPPGEAADGSVVTVETRRQDVAWLAPEELASADLICASALLDMMTADELDSLVASCASVGCPVLITLSVSGGVELAPADPLDGDVADAFNLHQRRATAGPDAVRAVADGFAALGRDVIVWPSPWRLGAEHAELVAQWFAGWLGAACEQRPELDAAAGPYRRRRLAQVAAGTLSLTLHHEDVLVRPAPPAKT
ncbi:hypothetical protein GCM10023169_37260 [Georgenia halophila]|uniref:Methyltransferase domain-containing protein n=1 Tax=Georgenia halophila TaxID=620889 RepID=A0ABP8LMU4_9MICO